MATPDRWPPWIEPRVDMTGATQLVNSTTAAPIAGLSVTFTPHADARVAVGLTVDCSNVAGAGVLVCRINLNGTPAAEQLNVAGASRGCFHQEVHFNLTAGTTYTLSADALTAAGTSFNIFATHTGLGPIIGMPNLHT
jgi:hypothetical protein